MVIFPWPTFLAEELDRTSSVHELLFKHQRGRVRDRERLSDRTRAGR